MSTVSQADVEAAELYPPAVRALAELQAAHDDPAVSVRSTPRWAAAGSRSSRRRRARWAAVIMAGLLGVVAWRYRREV
jgi:hypothetical protein